MITTRTIAQGVVAAFFALLPPHCAIAKGKLDGHPVQLTLLQPRAENGVAPIQFLSGWPLVLRLEFDGAEGIAANAGPPYFPGDEQPGWIIVGDPDDCLLLDDAFNADLADCAEGAVSNEFFVQFTADVDLPGVEEFLGNGAVRDAMGDAPLVSITSASSPPDLETRAYGPDVGDGIADGYGYHAGDDLPGLVLLSDTGVGIVLDADFNMSVPRQARNLAGVFDTVAYSLSDTPGLPALIATMVVPAGLFFPVVLVDECVGDPPGTAACVTAQQRVDGGPIEPALDSTPEHTLIRVLQNRNVTLRAFVVNGDAPALLTDMDGDQIVDIFDAELMGLTVLSKQLTLSFDHFADVHPCLANLGRNSFHHDLDGNGTANAVGFPCPAGPGDVTGIPRSAEPPERKPARRNRGRLR